MPAHSETGLLLMQGTALLLAARALRAIMTFVRSRDNRTRRVQPRYWPRNLRGARMPRLTAAAPRRNASPTERGNAAATSSPIARGWETR